MRKKHLMTAAAAVLMASMLSACGGSGSTETAADTTAADTSAADASTEAGGSAEGGSQAAASGQDYGSTFDVAGAGEVTLDVMLTSLGDSDGGPYLRSVMEDYMALYPNVTLNPVECSMNDLYTTLITQATAGTLPDIFTMSEAYSAN